MKFKIIKYVGVAVGIVLVLLMFFFFPVWGVEIRSTEDITKYGTMHEYYKTPIIEVTEYYFIYCRKPSLAIWAIVILCIGLLIVLFATKSAFFISLISNITAFVILCVYKGKFGSRLGAFLESGYVAESLTFGWIFIVFAFLVLLTIFSAFVCFYKPKIKTENQGE